ncbi:uncharacterized protein LOC116301831 [Actinia tenebrosa]|uniref:Uncharacterized protein LOC116301831 n=1 Tax=Actinia tenebrosa TaxID=6105 RepID=A0A6P8IJA0_ACTTE|nr:uncharacterized protein LOC116301831 [Actinia tenebrosa]
MAFFKKLLQSNLRQCLAFSPRCSFLHQNVFSRPLFFSNYFRIQAQSFSQNTTPKSIFNITEKSGKKSFSRNDPVVTIAKQIEESVRGIRSKSEALENYAKYKSTGVLSDGDFVRVLVRLAKSNDHTKYKRDKNNAVQLYEGLLNDIKNKSSQLKEFELADIIWSLGKLDITDPEWFAYFGSIIESKQDFKAFSNADLAMILWGHGKTNIAAPILFSHIQKEILRRDAKEFTTRELCQIVWSFARVMRASAKLFAAVRKDIQERDITEFNNQDLIMLMWAYSEEGVNVKPLFRFFKSELLNSKRLSEYGTKDLSVILWSFSNQRIKAQDLFAAVEREILTRPKLYFDDQSLVIIAWSYANTDNKSPRLFQLIEKQLMSIDLGGWSLHRLARILWSFTKTGFLNKKFLQKISNAMLFQDFADLSQNSLDEVVYTLQVCEHALSPKLVSAVEAELMKRAKEI